ASAGPVASAAGGPLSAAKVAAAVSPYVHGGALGTHVGVLVGGLSSGGVVVYRLGHGAFRPASVMKLLTTTAALAALGPEARFSTTVRRVGSSRTIVLVGGGDPLLASSAAKARRLYPRRADMATLAEATVRRLNALGINQVRLSYDDSLFTGPKVNPRWPATYVSEGVVPPIDALWVDEGQAPGKPGYAADPAGRAAKVFAAALARDGVVVQGRIGRRVSGAGDTLLARVQSPRLGDIVHLVLGFSDNNAAEVIGHQLGIAERVGGSFAGGVRAVRTVLRRLGVPTGMDRIYDASGLSRDNRLTPRTLVDVLRAAASPAHPSLRDVITGLPVAGFSGSLKFRFDTGLTAGRGRVRAKTGTLTGVSALAGIATDVQGDPMAFAVMADQVPATETLNARAALDRLTAALGGCRCR
ncbi:MAG: D-alanyl-D-alanine carboxypeptidase/D-alanyl-D-alanine-endopeptidase, partial [Actinomycetota bacterium]|nr:D-alanyl-D-alanine carboxypeptidase/D-alanyl-D-alanine-endopeptidase [Actinomycetota bacterium]